MQNRFSVLPDKTSNDKIIEMVASELPLYSNLEVKDLQSFACVSRYGHLFFTDALQTLQVRLLQEAGKAIVALPTHAEIEKILTMLKRLPHLVLRDIPEATDLSGRIFRNWKLLPLTYGAGDDELCFLFKPYFAIACGSEEAGEREWLRQLQEKEFLEVDPVKEQQIKQQLAGLLNAVIQAISNERFDNGEDANGRKILSPATLAAIATFREAFTASQPKIIDKGMHFRYNTLQETFDAFVLAAQQWNYDYKRCALFADGVLSHVLPYAPTNDLMRFLQGLYYLQDKKEPFKRVLTARDATAYADILTAESADFVLSGSCLDILFGPARGVRGGRGSGGRHGERLLEILCRAKTSNLQNLCSRANERQRPAV